MALPALVLVHGGGFAADCWEPTVELIRSVEPELKVLTVDLPGRRNKRHCDAMPPKRPAGAADIDDPKDRHERHRPLPLQNGGTAGAS